MPESNAISSFGTLLQRGDGADPEVFSTIAEVKDIKPPALSADTEEVTHQDSPGGWKEYLSTLLDGGEVTFDLNFIPTDTGHLALITDMTNRVKRNFKVIFPDGTPWSFTALVTGFEPDAPVSGTLSASVTLKVSGQPTFGA